MISKAPANSQTDTEGPDKRNRKGIQIFDRKDDIVGFIGGNALRDQIKIQKIPLCLLQLHHHDIRVRRRPQEIQAAVYGASGGSGGHSRPVPVLICNRHRLQWIFQRKRRVDLLPGVFAAIVKALRRRPGLISLIPDRQNPAASVLTPENRVPIIDPRIRETDHHISARQQERFSLQLCNAAGVQGLRIKALSLRPPHEFIRKAVELRHISILITGKRKRRQVLTVEINRPQPAAHRHRTEGIAGNLLRQRAFR